MTTSNRILIKANDLMLFINTVHVMTKAKSLQLLTHKVLSFKLYYTYEIL